ncbi:hypothetical protein AK812_SmicGene21818 [Symbiodinium microadriaticum]|uniref:Uncharacterized protein n=1 Tax=Symbiodinium microadriaticum TaxID=2951 RepID=A0A1Q9DLJ2_SYMMI|nr:hypothetical protein AK812_SmicGene21818 [Symbiodinium microadriaticum]
MVDSSGHRVGAEFRRCSGDALAFAHAFEEASKHLRSNLMADTDVSRDSDVIHDRIPGTGEEHSQIQPLVDMVAAGSPSTLEAEAVAALAALALSADPAGTTALLAALRDVQKTLVELCVNSRTSIDTAYPAARLVSKLVCKSDVDAEAQQIACDLTRAVCGATHLDSLVRGELAEAVRAVARKRTMQLPMQSGLDERQLAQASITNTGGAWALQEAARWGDGVRRINPQGCHHRCLSCAKIQSSSLRILASPSLRELATVPGPRIGTCTDVIEV